MLKEHTARATRESLESIGQAANASKTQTQFEHDAKSVAGSNR